MGHIWTERDRINTSNGHISNRGQGSNSLTCNVRLQVEAYPKEMILFESKVTAVERVQIGSHRVTTIEKSQTHRLLGEYFLHVKSPKRNCPTMT